MPSVKKHGGASSGLLDPPMTNKGLALVRSLVVSKIGRKGRRNDAAKPRRRGGKDLIGNG